MLNKVLFLFFEGLATHVIDSQVLIHCKNMKTLGIDFEIWAFTHNDDIYNHSLKRLNYAKELSGCEVKVFKSIRPAYPFSESINAYLVKKYIKEYNIDFKLLHARTDYAAHVAAFVTDQFIWDCRGDTLAEFETSYKKSKNILGKFYKKYKILQNITHAKKSKKAIFVSTFLKNKLQYEKEGFTLGCLADDRLFFYSRELRLKQRKLLNFSDKDKIFIYSGGMSPYQLFPKIVDLFQSLNSDWKFLILTTQLNLAKDYLKNIEPQRYVLKSVELNQVNDFLNAADVGVILRENNDLNRAASPTKYAEYSMSGLKIIYSDGIGDLEIYEKTIKNRLEIHEIDDFLNNESERKEIFQNATKILSKQSMYSNYKKIYEI